MLLNRLYVLTSPACDQEAACRRRDGQPDGSWIAQQARNLAMNLGERLEELRFLIGDRDTKYTTMFDAVFEADASEIINTPPCAPRAMRSASASPGQCTANCPTGS